MSVEIKRINAELARVIAARLEMEVKIAELEEATRRVQNEIRIQDEKETELKQKLAGMKG